MINDSQQDWPDILPGIMMAYRSTAARATEFSPYFLCFGKEMVTPIDTAINPNLTEVSPNYRETLKSFIDNIKLAREVARENILRSQTQMKEYYDRKSEQPKYKISDFVWLYDPTTPIGFSRKLKPRWTGPYTIVEIGPNSTYRLRHYETNVTTENLVNAQRLKPAFLPWESRIRREDPDNNDQRINVPRNQAANANVNNDAISQNQPQTRPNRIVGMRTDVGRPYQTTNSELHNPTTSAQPQVNPPQVEKVINLRRNGQIKWYQVKLVNVPGLKWYKHGAITIPQRMIEDCLKVRTWTGKRRKRKRKPLTTT